MRFEGFYASFSPSFHPMTHCSFTYAQGDRYVFLWPALLFQLPSLFASFFSPIGFLWCSHTSYTITLYFLLPGSVMLTATGCVLVYHPALLYFIIPGLLAQAGG